MAISYGTSASESIHRAESSDTIFARRGGDFASLVFRRVRKALRAIPAGRYAAAGILGLGLCMAGAAVAGWPPVSVVSAMPIAPSHW